MQAEVVRQVLSLAHQSVKETHRDRLDAYIRAYCRAIPPEVLSETEPHVLLAFAMERFAFLEEDFGKTVKVAIRDPETTLLSDEAPSTVIETRLPDCAFIIRTIKSFLRQQGLQLQFVLHPIHGVVLDHGQITGIDAQRGTKYSQVYLQVSSIAPEKREALRADLEKRLELTLLVNRDRSEMMARLEEARVFLCKIAGRDPSNPSPRESQSIPREVILRAASTEPRTQRENEANEAVELIDWLKDDNFILLGYAWFPYTKNGNGERHVEKGLGLFHATDRKNLEEVIGEIVATRKTRDELYSYYRTDYMTVVRSVAQVRYFGVAQVGPDGTVTGEHVFIGLMSTKALKHANRRVPIVGKRIKEVMAKLEDPPGQLRVHQERRDPRLDPRRGPVLLEHRRDPERREPVPARRVQGSSARVRVAPSRRPPDHGGLRRAAHAVLRGAARGAVGGDPHVPPGAAPARVQAGDRRRVADPSPLHRRQVPAERQGLRSRAADRGPRVAAPGLGRSAPRPRVQALSRREREDDAVALVVDVPRDHLVPTGDLDALRLAVPRLVQGHAPSGDRAARHRPDREARRRRPARRAGLARRRPEQVHVAADRLAQGAAPQRRRAVTAPHGAAHDEPARRAARAERQRPRRLHHGLRGQRRGRQEDRGPGDARSPRRDHPARPHRPAPRRSPARPRLPRRARLEADRRADHLPQLLRAGVPGLRRAERRRRAAQAPALRGAAGRVLRDQVLDRPQRVRGRARGEAAAHPRAQVRRGTPAGHRDPGGPDPPLLHRPRRGDAAHQLLPARPRRYDLDQDRVGARRAHAAAVPALRDLRPRTRRSRASTCAAARSHAAASATAIAPTTSAPRCSACSAPRR